MCALALEWVGAAYRPIQWSQCVGCEPRRHAVHARYIHPACWGFVPVFASQPFQYLILFTSTPICNDSSPDRTANTICTVIVTIPVCCINRVIGSVITCRDDFVNLAVRFLIVEIVNFALARTGVS